MRTVEWSKIRRLWGVFSLCLCSVARAPGDLAWLECGSDHVSWGRPAVPWAFSLAQTVLMSLLSSAPLSLPLHLLQPLLNTPALHHWGLGAALEGSACFTSFPLSFRKQKGKVSTNLHPHHQVSMSRPLIPQISAVELGKWFSEAVLPRRLGRRIANAFSKHSGSLKCDASAAWLRFVLGSYKLALLGFPLSPMAPVLPVGGGPARG